MEKAYYSIIEPIILTASKLEVFSNKYLFGPLELTVSSMKILLILKRKGRQTAKEILRNVGGTKSNISQRLNLLEKKGYIKKYQMEDMKDGREIFIELTPNGKKKVAILYKHIKKFKLEFESTFSSQEISQHSAFFRKLSRLIEIREQQFSKHKSKNILKN